MNLILNHHSLPPQTSASLDQTNTSLLSTGARLSSLSARLAQLETNLTETLARLPPLRLLTEEAENASAAAELVGPFSTIIFPIFVQPLLKLLYVCMYVYTHYIHQWRFLSYTSIAKLYIDTHTQDFFEVDFLVSLETEF